MKLPKFKLKKPPDAVKSRPVTMSMLHNLMQTLGEGFDVMALQNARRDSLIAELQRHARAIERKELPPAWFDPDRVNDAAKNLKQRRSIAPTKRKTLDGK